MTAWWIAALVPGWLACSVLVALAVGRAVSIRDQRPRSPEEIARQARRVRADLDKFDRRAAVSGIDLIGAHRDLEAIVNATRED